jgi:hypothetical protein
MADLNRFGEIMSVSRDEVIWAYRLILGREPETEAAITNKLSHENVESLRTEFLTSEEISSKIFDFSVGSYHKRKRGLERHVVVKELALPPAGRASILLTHSPAGRLKPHILPYMELLLDSGFAVLLVVEVDRPLELLDNEIAAAQGIIVRDNSGSSFRAWAHALKLQPELFGASLLILTNDSVLPTANIAAFRKMILRMRDCPADIVGLTASHEYGWHVQSYFMGLKPKALSSLGFQEFVEGIQRIDDKDDVIRTFEEPFTRTMQGAGLTIAALFSSPFATKPTYFGWRELVEQGFPFIKLLFLCNEFNDISDWPDVLTKLRDTWPAVLKNNSFDIELVRASILAADIASVPAGTHSGLLVNANRFLKITSAPHPLRVAYFGPWNYDSSGVASREMLCVLRHTSVRLNAYPVTKPMESERLICPPIELIDFDGRPDVALVHFNPDAYHLLSEEQLSIIQSAKHRIGYWDLDNDLPLLNLAHNPYALDRILAASDSCASLSKAATDIPIDVIPMPVPSGPAYPSRATVAVHSALGRAADADSARGCYQALAKLIEGSFASLLANEACGTPSVTRGNRVTVPPPPPQFNIDLSNGQRFDEIAPRDGVIPIPLAHDLSWANASLPDGDPTDWLFFAPGNAKVCPDAFDLIRDAAMLRPDVVLFYADDVALDEDVLNQIRLKPAFDITLFVAQDYIGAPVIIRREALSKIGGLNPSYGSAVLYDVVLRVACANFAIGRITKVLIGTQHKRALAELEARCLALRASTVFNEFDLISAAKTGQLIQRRRISDGVRPAVTLVIPTCRSVCASSHETYIERLLRSIAAVDWPMDRLNVIVGDDFIESPDWASKQWPFHLRWLATPRAKDEPFNYAAKMNLLWREAVDDQIIFMNDDVLPHGVHWLTALVGFASDEAVGGVGPLLYYEDGSIQHAGMIPYARSVAHAWQAWPADAKTYQNWAGTQREWSMITGAIFATRRSILDRVNGFDERFSLEFNDVDLCLRIRNMGYRIIFNPDAQFTHVEKASRRNALPSGADIALFRSRWSRWLDNDPASHPSFDHHRLDLVPVPETDAWYIAKF